MYFNKISMNVKQFASALAIAGIVVVGLIATHQNSNFTPFQAWKNKFSIKYDSKFEEVYREKIFLQNLAKIELHNSNSSKTFDMGINQFTAMTQQEFKQTYLGFEIYQDMIANEQIQEDIVANDINWVDQGAVTEVKTQGQCGSGWAFATTGGLQGLSKIEYQNLQNFSESQLIDCSGSYGTQGCSQGIVDGAFKYVRDKGIVHENQYPYVPKKNTCKRDGGNFKISGYTDIRNNCNDLSSAIINKPVSVAVDSTNWGPYKSGVFNLCAKNLNQFVLLVGVQSGNWIVKNSWGPSWGEKGYIRIAPGNTCGICSVGSYPNK